MLEKGRLEDTQRIKMLEKGRLEDTQRIKMLEKGCLEDTQRIKMLEKGHLEDAQRIEMLEKGHQKDAQGIEMLEKGHLGDAQRIEMLEKRNNDLSNEVDHTSTSSQMLPTIDDVQSEKLLLDSNRLKKVEDELKEFKELYNAYDHGQLQLEQETSQRIGYLEDEIDNLKRLYAASVSSSKVSAFGNEMVPYEKSSREVEQLEEKVLEVQRTLKVISAHHSELELQLQASLASTHNGAFLWRIPEVRRRIRDAKIGHITSIYSPPFYTGRNGYKMCIRAYQWQW